MNYHIAVIPGDGIGPEIVTEAKKVLDKIGDIYGHQFQYEELDMGGCSIDKYGEPLSCLAPSEAEWESIAGMSCRRTKDRRQDF